MLELQAQAFLEQIMIRNIRDRVDFLRVCKQACAYAHTPQRSEIAYNLVSLGSQYNDEPSIMPITDILSDLELPDGHVDTSDGLNVQQKWQKLEHLVDTELAKLQG